MTTEEERKAAAEKIGVRNYTPASEKTVHIRLSKVIDIECALTRTEKRLEVAEGLLERARDGITAQWMTDLRAFLNPPAEGE